MLGIGVINLEREMWLFKVVYKLMLREYRIKSFVEKVICGEGGRRGGV